MNSIMINIGRNKRRVILSQIIYIEKQLRKAKVCLLSGEEIYFYSTMKELRKILGRNSFIQIQRSFIVSMEYIKTIQKGKIELENGEIFNIGKSYQKEVSINYMKFIESKIGKL